MNPLGTRARIEELARLLDGAVAGPGVATAGYATLATRLRAVAPLVEPRPEFRAALRQRLVAVATVQGAVGVPAPAGRPKALETALEAAGAWTQSRKAQRRLGVTAGAMAGVIAVTGVGIASSRSLPGQPFYALKRGAEDVQLQLASGDTAKGTKHLEFAATRLREVRALAEGEGELSLGAVGSMPLASGQAFGASLTSRIDGALSDFDRETRSGSALLEAAYRKTGKPEPLRIIKAFAHQQQARLSALLPTLPPTVRDDAQASLTLVTGVGTDATQLLALGTCGGECYPGNGGPTLPTEPSPSPGATVTPDSTNNVPACTCAQPSGSPEPTPDVAPSPDPTPSPGPSGTSRPASSPTPSASPSPGLLPSLLPTPLPSLLPTPLPTILPTTLPTSLTILPTSLTILPTALPTLLPGLLTP
ncbi:MAG: DUF5667 domain-containing protein [Mycobacteriales bacterium]